MSAPLPRLILVAVASDPEWLPSTIVQSSAAIVAIVGGLLIARLVGISSDRGAFVRRLEEVNDQIRSAETRLRDLVARRAGWDLADFISSATDLYFTGDARTAEELASQIDHGADAAEKRQFAEMFLEWLSDHEEEIRKAHHEDGARSLEDLRSLGLEIEPIFEPVAVELLEQLQPKSRSPYGFQVPGPILPSFAVDDTGRTVTLQRWDTLLRDIERAEREVEDLKGERDRILIQLNALNPRGVKGTMTALAVVVIAGIAFPVVVMAMRLTELGAVLRWTMVGAFLASVMVVGSYIYWFSRSIGESEHEDSRSTRPVNEPGTTS